MKILNKSIITLVFIALNIFSNAQCFEIESILVDACGSPEQDNEMVRFKVGSTDLCSSDLTVTWPNGTNGWLGLIQNATTAQITADLNATILGCGQLIEPSSCVLPANSTVIIVTSTLLDVSANSFESLNETVYIIYQNSGNGQGHFSNHGASASRTLTMTFSAPVGCTDQVTYDRNDLIDQSGASSGEDGATVNFNPAGTPTYINNGCQAPFEPFEIDLTAAEVISGTQNICPGDVIQVGVTITGPYTQLTWTGLNGNFDNPNAENTNYNSVLTDNVNFNITVEVETTCGDILTESIPFTINDSPDVDPAGPFSTSSGTQTMTSDETGGTWNSDCGACINSTTGIFDPSVSGEGTFQICYTGVCGQDCISVIVSDACIAVPVVSEVTCFEGSDGAINISNTSGTVGNIVYTITDSNGDLVNTNDDTSISQANNLTAGNYDYTITDDNGCVFSSSVVVDQGLEMTGDLTVVNVDCFGEATGEIDIANIVNNQGNYNYEWTINGVEMVSELDSLIDDLQASSYELTVTDAAGCEKVYVGVVGQSQEIILTPFVKDSAICRINNLDEGYGQVYATGSGGSNGNGGGANFEFNWLDLTTGEAHNGSTWGGRTPGMYSITLENDLGCIVKDTIMLDSLSPIALFTAMSDQFTTDYVGTAPVEVTFENLSENYGFANHPTYGDNEFIDTLITWTFGVEGDFYQTEDPSDIIKLFTSEGLYTVCLNVKENLNGCEDSMCIDIQIYDQPSLTIPNVFTPDGDGINDNFFFPNSAIVEFDCSVFDRWGKQVFTFDNINTGWDGFNESNGKACTDGVYFYMYEGVSSNGTEYKGQGNINLIRKQ